MDWRTPITLTGKHVRLEPMSEAHVPGLTAIGLEDSIWEHMLYGDVHSEDDIRNWVRDILSRPDLPFTVVHLASGRVAGATRYLNITSEHRGLEIGGTWYGAEFQRTAVNTECKYLLLQYAFETLGCIRVQFKTLVMCARNVPLSALVLNTKVFCVIIWFCQMVAIVIRFITAFLIVNGRK